MKLLKTGLILSFLANLIMLAGLAGWLKPARNGDISVPATTASATSQPPVLVSTVTVPPATPPEAAEPFHWSQLQSTNDYRTYVANLRAAGCPERTVRAIVMADVDFVFYKQRKELNVDGREPGPWSGQNQVRVTDELLGKSALAKSTPAVRAATPTDVAEDTAVPLVFQKVDLDALGLSDEEKAAIQGLQQRFEAEIAPQNPADPAYRERWLQAQPEIDESLRALIGGQTYMDYQSAAQNPGTPPPSAQ